MRNRWHWTSGIQRYHTGQGKQHASADYQKILEKHGIICNLSRKGNHYDNAVAERLFGEPKSEKVITSGAAAKQLHSQV